MPVSPDAESVGTSASFSLRNGSLAVTVEAEDPNIDELIATPTDPIEDRFLYEEDCIQFALWSPDRPECVQYLLINPLGKRREGPGAPGWNATTRSMA